MSNLDWGKQYPTQEAISILSRLASSHLLEAVNTDERAQVLRGMLDRRDFLGLCEYELTYRDTDSANALIHIRQALGLLTKYEDLPLEVDRERSAWEKFRKAEEQCRLTNQCFQAWSRGGFQFRPYVEAVLHGVMRKMDQMLGDAPTVEDLHLVFGKGATTDVAKAKSNPRTKLSAGYQCSASLLRLVPRIASMMPGWTEYVGEVKQLRSLVRDGKLGFVAKTALTHRSIVVEPSLNVMFQRGIGREMERRIKPWGLDITKQEPNQRLARRGSIDGTLATIDLSSASDTIASGLVRHLLTEDWLELLEAGRTPTVSYQGERFNLQMFSSMGNGFTFPLQTALFYAIATTVAEMEGVPTRDIRTYGDDIIIPASCAESFVAVLRDLGFTPNPSKSFWKGPFRESCGADYFCGIDIRPWYAKTALRMADLFALHNYYVGQFDHTRAELVLEYIPESARKWGPAAYGDGHLHCDRKLSRERNHSSCGFGGYTFETYSWTSPRHKIPLPGDYLFPSYTIYARHGSSGENRLSHVVQTSNVRAILSTPALRQSLVEWAVEIGSGTTHQKLVGRRGSEKTWEWNTALPDTVDVKILSIYTFNPR